MSDDPKGARQRPARDAVLPDLAELCRMHDVSLDLIRSSHDVDQLLDGVLEEYERRLREMSAETLGDPDAPLNVEEAKKLRALVMFAGHAAALKEKAAAATQMRQRAEELERVNAELEQALRQEERSRRRLDDVLAALDAGIMVVGVEGRVQNANRAASDLTGVSPGELVGHEAQALLGDVGRGADGEVSCAKPGSPEKVVIVARRDLPSDPQAEVVLLSDITERDREMRERHRIQRFGELLRTLGVLSHKINNPLTSLLGRAQILRMKAQLDPDVDKAARVIEESAKRIAEYIRELAGVVKEGKEDALQPLLELDDGPATGTAPRK